MMIQDTRKIKKKRRKNRMKKLYIAYGSNMNMQQMAMRCPKATPLGKYILEDYKLEFRG